MPDASAACSKSGVLEKNHKGASFAKGSQKRFFSSDGFHVSYYTDASMRKCTGSFDLRNVIGLSSAEDPGVKQGLTLLISDCSDGSVQVPGGPGAGGRLPLQQGTAAGGADAAGEGTRLSDSAHVHVR